MSKTITKVIGGLVFTAGSSACLTKPSNESFVSQATMNLDPVSKFTTKWYIDNYAKFDDYIFFKKVTFPHPESTETEPLMISSYGFFNNWFGKCE